MLYLDKDFKFEELKERNLTHLHATILHGTRMPERSDLLNPETDIRFLIQTSAPVLPNSELFK